MTAGTPGLASDYQRSPRRTWALVWLKTYYPSPPASQPPSCNPDALSRACPKPQLHSMGGAPCLLTVPRPCLIDQGILTAVVHVLIQVVRVHGARWHLLEVEAGLRNALYQLQRIQSGTIGCLMQRNHQGVERTPSLLQMDKE